MVGLVIATHGHLAREMVATAEQIVGKLPACEAVDIEAGASPDQIKSAMKDAIRRVDTGEGVLVFADLCGGTPCNQSLMLYGQQQVPIEVLTGVNLPMLLNANSLRAESMPLAQLASTLTQYGQRNITCATASLRAAEAQHRS